MTAKLFSELGLSPELLKAIDKLGFEQASPIQAEAIPVLMSGKDIVGQSQTGSGKTAAFGIPAVEKVDLAKRAVQVLILCPTRELAVQVSEEIHKLALFKRGIHALPIYGGQSYERQFMGLRAGAQIVIGTPGRVMDHMRRGTLRLDTVKMLVLDEADVMLNMGFREDIETILQEVPEERQTVFFSATMPKPIRDLIERFSRDPVNVRIEQKAMTVATVDQYYFEVDRRYKIEALTRLIDLHDLKLGIIFCNTKRMVDELTDSLNAQGYSADRLHGDMSQAMRDRVMGKFRKSGLEFLVATDVAARGIDVDDIEVVFNYDIPYDVEDYVHRIGRTGRAGRSGRAITFASGREVWQLQNIERFTRQRIQRGRVPSREQVEEARTDVFLGKIRATLAAGEFQAQQPLIERLMEEGFESTDIAAALLHQMKNGDPVVAAEPKVKASAKFEENTRPAAKAAPVAKAKPAPKPAPQPAAGVGGEFAAALAVEPVETNVPTPMEASAAPASEASTTEPSAVETPADATPAGEAPAAPTPKPKKTVPFKPMAEKPMLRSSYGQRTEGSDRPPARGPRDFRDERGPRPAPRDFGDARPPARPYGDERAPRPGYGNERPGRPYEAGPTARPSRDFARPPGRPGEFEPRPAYVKRPAYEKPAPRDEFAAPAERPAFQKGPRVSRATPPGQTRLWMSVGSEGGVLPGDVVGAILGETGLPKGTVGAVDIRDRHTFVDVTSEHADEVITKLSRANIKGSRLKVKVA